MQKMVFRKTMGKMLSIVCSLALVAGLLPAQLAYAEPAVQVDTVQEVVAPEVATPIEEPGDGIYWVNPAYVDEFEAPLEALADEGDVVIDDGTPVFSTEVDALAYIRGQMKERSATIVFQCDGICSNDGDVSTLFKRALEETGNAWEGDYLRYGYSSIWCRFGEANDHSYAVLALTYYTTNEQERELDQLMRTL